MSETKPINPNQLFSHCYQCGLPNNETEHITKQILGTERYFCCHGCKGIAELIVSTFNEDYYRLREKPDASFASEITRLSLEQIANFDRTEVQLDFIRHPDPDKQNIVEAYLLLENIRCAACIWLNERHIRQLKGVQKVRVDYTSQQAYIIWDEQQIKLSEILKAIASIGYSALPFDPEHREKLIKEQKRKNSTRLLFTALLGMEVMAHAIATYWMGGFDSAGQLQLWEKIGRWTDLLVVSIMLVYSGADFYISAWRDIKNKHAGMDLPIVIGLSSAYIGSLIATIRQQHDVYFDSIAMFIFLMLAARIYELKGRLVAANALDRLLKIIPKTANRILINQSNRIEEILITEIAEGDIVLVYPGEIVPLDGKIISGKSSFNESHLTGEMMPVVHQVGDDIINGSCNIDQPIQLEVSKTYSQSTLFNVFKLMEKGSSTRFNYTPLTEKFAQWFVWAILMIAAISVLFWSLVSPSQVLPVTIAVLIVSCPCALALATPVAVSLSSGILASDGILSINMKAMENLAQAETFVFDKTGTLTLGKPVLIDNIVPTTKITFDEKKHLLNIAVSLEWTSEHPIAQAFKRSSPICPYQMSHHTNFPGQGVAATINKEQWKIGKLSFCCPKQQQDPDMLQQIEQARSQIYIPVFLSKNDSLMGYFLLKDPLRASAANIVPALKRLGVKHFYILSGDNSANIAPIASELGIGKFYGSMSPQDKLDWIQSEQSSGHRVVMIGDGINDAPILTAADASISFSEASDLAKINSDFVILGQNINLVPKLYERAKKNRAIIIQNLTWAIVYNLVAIPFAFIGWLPPWGAALGMSLSSFIVISNSLRLNLFFKKTKKKANQQ